MDLYSIVEIQAPIAQYFIISLHLVHHIVVTCQKYAALGGLASFIIMKNLDFKIASDSGTTERTAT